MHGVRRGGCKVEGVCLCLKGGYHLKCYEDEGAIGAVAGSRSPVQPRQGLLYHVEQVHAVISLSHMLNRVSYETGVPLSQAETMNLGKSSTTSRLF